MSMIIHIGGSRITTTTIVGNWDRQFSVVFGRIIYVKIRNIDCVIGIGVLLT